MSKKPRNPKSFTDFLADIAADESRKTIANIGARIGRHVQQKVGELAGGLEKEGACICTPVSVAAYSEVKGRMVNRLVHYENCPASTGEAFPQ